ncbi:type II secretion system protein [Legionella impletisoli]|uniref:Uncharacterized protein n=1 Tax=Legionella impletisoli TaxID=343510 RepID=A0A917JVR6_9GAMM|nr:hypothetical protein [Legionella impletisoli]GGI86931.1 hypothetical protein GCM10007966_14540 [Legionella impletisoli]
MKMKMKKSLGYGLMEVALGIAIVGAIAVGTAATYNNIGTDAEANVLAKLASDIAEAAKVNYYACQSGGGTCATLADCDAHKTLFVGGAWPSGVTVADGTTSGCKITYGSSSLDNYAVPGV